MSTRSKLRVVLIFSTEDQTWLRVSKTPVPDFFTEHAVTPQRGDGLRVGGRQFIVQGRVWEHDAQGPLLRLLLGDSQAESDTVFG
jgi:hypothetical protein